MARTRRTLSTVPPPPIPAAAEHVERAVEILTEATDGWDQRDEVCMLDALIAVARAHPAEFVVALRQRQEEYDEAVRAGWGRRP